jgi:hypothetical protein
MYCISLLGVQVVDEAIIADCVSRKLHNALCIRTSSTWNSTSHLKSMSTSLENSKSSNS